MAPCFNNLRLISTFRLTQRKRNVFVVRINTALWGQLSVNKPWCWQSDGGQEWTIRASAGDLQGYITRRGLWEARHLSGDLGSSTAFWVMICIMKHQSTLRGSQREWWWWWGWSPAQSKWDVTPRNLQNEAPAKAFHLELLAKASYTLPHPSLSVIFTETGAKCFKRGDGNRPGGGFEGNVIIIRKMQWDQECLMHKCTKSDILLQLEGFQKLLEKAGKCVWDGDSEMPV